MPNWTDGMPQKIIDAIPQICQNDYDKLKHILFLHSKHQYKCEKIVKEEKDIYFKRILQWEDPSLHKLYTNLVLDNEVHIKSRSLFRYKKDTISDMHKDL